MTRDELIENLRESRTWTSDNWVEMSLKSAHLMMDAAQTLVNVTADILRLTAERDAALKEIERLQDVCGDSADRMVALCKERDDARIEVCRLLARNRTEGTDESEPGFHATARGWNCFYDESFDDVSGD